MMTTPSNLTTPLGAFLRPYPLDISRTQHGLLQGRTFAAKDLFDVEGYVTGCGHPLITSQNTPAAATAPFLGACLDEGAILHGKTLTDELAFSINGENAHYGTPENVHAPGCIPGGSSNGSAAATAGEIVDFAFGSDTGGSVRIPASYCGLFGIRTSHGLISLTGSALLAPGFDTIGWFARDPELFRDIGRVVLPDTLSETSPRRLLIVDDAFGLLDPALKDQLSASINDVASMFDQVEHITLSEDAMEQWLLAFRYIQGREIYEVHGRWLDRYQPEFGPGVKERFVWVQNITDEDVSRAKALRQQVVKRLSALLDANTVMLLPTTSQSAPLKGMGPPRLDDVRALMMRLSCIAGLGSLPQVSLPLAQHDGKPLGLSLIGSRMSDRALLQWVREFCEEQNLVWQTGRMSRNSRAN